jgi:uncharacterized membrane protein YbhN (UPF0104 family)
LLPLALLPLLLQQRALIPVANHGLRWVGRQPLGAGALLPTRETILVFGAYACVHCLNGLAFYLVILSVTTASFDPALAIGAYSLGAAAGVAVIFVPSGLGVREAVLVAALSGTLTTEDALVAAAAARAVSVLGDFALFGLLSAADLASRPGRGGEEQLPSTARPLDRPEPAE